MEEVGRFSAMESTTMAFLKIMLRKVRDIIFIQTDLSIKVSLRTILLLDSDSLRIKMAINILET